MALGHSSHTQLIQLWTSVMSQCHITSTIRMMEKPSENVCTVKFIVYFSFQHHLIASDRSDFECCNQNDTIHPKRIRFSTLFPAVPVEVRADYISGHISRRLLSLTLHLPHYEIIFVVCHISVESDTKPVIVCFEISSSGVI